MENVNKLVHIAEFRKILNDYVPSKKHQEFFASLPLVLLAGPTAAGRNTLISILVSTGRYNMIVSDTTRKPRMVNGALEQNGEVYWFKDEETVLSGLQNGEYIEAAIIHGQQVTGASISELQTAGRESLINLKEIEVQGVETYRKYNTDALCIFLLPPTFEIWMQRLRDRGEMDEEELRRRLQSAEAEIVIALENDFYQFVINNEIHEAAMAIDELANGRQPDSEKQQLGRDHAEQLVIDVRLYLQSK